MATAALVSRALGFVRATLLVLVLGGTAASVGGQAFAVANEVPTAVLNVIAGSALAAILVPEVTSVVLKRRPDAHLNRLVTWGLLAAGVVTVVLVVAAPLFVEIYAPTWPDDWKTLATALTYWCLPQVFFLFAFTVLAQVLNAHGRYSAGAWAPGISNVVTIVGLLIFFVMFGAGDTAVEGWTSTMIVVLGSAAVAGPAVQFFFLVVMMRRAQIPLRFDPKPPSLASVGRPSGYVLGGTLVTQLAAVVVAIAATSAGEQLNAAGIDGAGLNSLMFATLLLLLPHGIFAVSISTEAFTRASHCAEIADVHGLRLVTRAAVVRVVGVMVPSTAALLVLSPTLTAVLWGTPVIGEITAVLALGLVPLSLSFLFTRVLMALRLSAAVFWMAVAGAATTALSAWFAMAFAPAQLAVLFVAAGTAIAQLVQLVVAWLVYSRAVAPRASTSAPAAPSRLWASVVAGGAGAALAALTLVMSRSIHQDDVWLSALFSLAASSVAFMAGYLGVGLMLREPTLQEVKGLVRRRRSD